MNQHENESIAQYVTRLRRQAETCEVGYTLIDEHIRDQIIEKCSSKKLRRKLLEQSKDLKLDKLINITRSLEAANQKASCIEGTQTDQIHKIGSSKVNQETSQPKH